MPKIKTHTGAKKRFKLTASGKVKQTSTGRRHKLNAAKKARKVKRSMRAPNYADKTNVAAVRTLLPYK